MKHLPQPDLNPANYVVSFLSPPRNDNKVAAGKKGRRTKAWAKQSRKRLPIIY